MKNNDPRLFASNDNLLFDKAEPDVDRSDTVANPFKASERTPTDRARARERIAAEGFRMKAMLAKLAERQAVGAGWNGADNSDHLG